MNGLRIVIALLVCSFLTESCTVIEPQWFTYMQKARQSCEQGDFVHSDEHLRRALSHVQTGQNPAYTTGPGVPRNLSGQLATLAGCYADWQKYDRAESLYKQAFALSPEGRYEGGLADLYRKQGKISDAVLQLQKLVHDEETSYVPKNDNTLHWMGLESTLFDLADCYAVQGNFADAESVYKRGLQVLRESSESDGHLAARLIQVGKFYFKHGNLAQAKSLFEQALSVAEQIQYVGGETHTAEEVSCLADLYSAEGVHDKAESLYRQALQGYYSFPTDEEIATRRNYASLLRQLKRVPEAEEMESIANDRQQALSKQRTGPKAYGRTIYD